MHYTTIMVATVQWGIFTTHISWTHFTPSCLWGISTTYAGDAMNWDLDNKGSTSKMVFLLFLSGPLTALPLLRHWSL